MQFKGWFTVLTILLLIIGCGRQSDEKTQAAVGREEAEIQAALAKLDPADRKLAEAQRYCAVQASHRLGSMDTPYKLMLNGQPVFLCCDGCAKKAKADPEKTLARVKELIAKNAK